LSEQVEASTTPVDDCRAALAAGKLSLPVQLGLSTRASHIERAERECLSEALHVMSSRVGPAARIIDCGPFAGLAMGSILTALERPKAVVIMTTTLDARPYGRLQEGVTTAQITHVQHDAVTPGWPLEAVGAGTTCVVISGGGFGLLPPPDAFAVLENASQALNQGDFIAVTLELVRDGAIMEAIYADFGSNLVGQALTALGRSEGLQSRTFYESGTHSVRFGAVAIKNAFIAWNGKRCALADGTWLNMGAMHQHTLSTLGDLHPDFEAHDQWISQDKAAALVLLRKI
jgi:Histidine-specific methyltransferase, SAM-dependent